MSIIARAIKKAEQERRSGGETRLKPRPDVIPAFQARPAAGGGASKTGLTLLLPAASILLIALLAVTFFLVKARKGAGTNPVLTPVSIAAEKTLLPAADIKASVSARKRTSLPSLALTGIMYSSTTPKAIINGSILTPGSAISGLTVKEILIDKVILTDGVEDYELKVR